MLRRRGQHGTGECIHTHLLHLALGVGSSGSYRSQQVLVAQTRVPMMVIGISKRNSLRGSSHSVLKAICEQQQ